MSAQFFPTIRPIRDPEYAFQLLIPTQHNLSQDRGKGTQGSNFIRPFLRGSEHMPIAFNHPFLTGQLSQTHGPSRVDLV